MFIPIYTTNIQHFLVTMVRFKTDTRQMAPTCAWDFYSLI